MQFLVCCSNSAGAAFDDLPLHPVRAKKQWLRVSFFPRLFGAPRRTQRRLDIAPPRDSKLEPHVIADDLFSDCSPGLPPPVPDQAPAPNRRRRSFGSLKASESGKLTRRSGLRAILVTKKRARSASHHALPRKSRDSPSRIDVGLPQGFKHVFHLGIDSVQNTTPYALASIDDALYDSDSERWRREFDAQLEVCPTLGCASPTLKVTGSTDEFLTSTLLVNPRSARPTPTKSLVNHPGPPHSFPFHNIKRKAVPQHPELDRELPDLPELVEAHNPRPVSSPLRADASTYTPKSQCNGVTVETSPFHNVKRKRKRVPSLAELDRRAAEGANSRHDLYLQKRVPLSPLPRSQAELPPSPAED